VPPRYPPSVRIAIAAALLILVVSPRSAAADPLFELHEAADVPLLFAPALVALVPELRKHEFDRPACAGACDAGRVPAFDRWALGLCSAAAATLSDVLVLALPVGALGLDLASEHGRAFWPDAVVILQAISLGTLVVELTKLAVRRTRPYVYGLPTANLPSEADASLSFFSGHTTIAFASAVAGAEVFRRRHRGDSAVPIVWATGVALASTVAVTRVLAGKHFPSDVLAGAIVGTALGLLLPALHERP